MAAPSSQTASPPHHPPAAASNKGSPSGLMQARWGSRARPFGTDKLTHQHCKGHWRYQDVPGYWGSIRECRSRALQDHQAGDSGPRRVTWRWMRSQRLEAPRTTWGLDRAKGPWLVDMSHPPG